MESFYTQSVNEYYVALFRENFRKRAERIAALRSREDALQYTLKVRNKIRSLFHLPGPGPVPAPQDCGAIRHEGFRIEKRIYEIRPGDFVTTNIYIPENLSGPVPGVLFLCGHSAAGKFSAPYQTCCTTLVRNGCVVLTFDPSGQGERQLYPNEPGGDMMNHPTWQHNMIARQMELVGWSYASWCLQDAVRMLDVLCSLPEVDPERIGVTGNSGGGNMSAFLTAVDDRPAAIAPSCYLTSWRHNIENELPCDAEQEPPGFVGVGLEMADLLIAAAPRPHLILGQRNDFFDPRGTVETAEEVRRFYGLLGRAENIEYFIGGYNHGYHDTNRDAMYRFFAKHLGFEFKVPESKEPPAETEKDLRCTGSGNVLSLPGARHPHDFCAEEAERLAQLRKTVPWETRIAELGKLLGVGKVKVPYFRVLRQGVLPNHHTMMARFALETEGNLPMAILYRPFNTQTCFHLGDGPETAELFIPHRDALSEIKLGKTEGAYRYALDMRGVGQLTPGSCNMQRNVLEYHWNMPDSLTLYDQHGRAAFGYYGCDYHYWACGSMLGDPFTAGRVRDVLGAMKLLAANGVKEIRLVANGQGGIPAALAALYFKDCQVTVKWIDPPPSFESLMRLDVVPLPFSSLIPGILKYLDLPELFEKLKD